MKWLYSTNAKEILRRCGLFCYIFIIHKKVCLIVANLALRGWWGGLFRVAWSNEVMWWVLMD